MALPLRLAPRRSGKPRTVNPVVSILIPCYNAAPWLAASLDSVLAQTWAEKEVILINDGSTDNSLAIARRYESRGVRVVTQPNAGQAAARNHALRLARGEFVKFFDSDDLLSPDMIERQVRALSSRPNAIAYGEWARFHTAVEEARFETQPGWHDAAPVDWLVEMLHDSQPMMQCGQFLIPRPLLDRTGGWDERLSLHDDFEFFARLVLASAGIVFTGGARLYYRSGLPGSLSGRTTAAAWRSAAQSFLLATGYLLDAENSPRTRAVAATILQILVFDMYPNTPELVEQLESRIAELGGSKLAPQGGKGFLLARRFVGWKTARWLQIWAGKRGRPVRLPG